MDYLSFWGGAAENLEKKDQLLSARAGGRRMLLSAF